MTRSTLLVLSLLTLVASAQSPADPYKLIVPPGTVINARSAVGDLIVGPSEALLINQKAALKREDVRQKKLERYKEELKHLDWERKRRWKNLDEQQERIVQHELKRSREHPPLTEVLDGVALNVLLNDLIKRPLPSGATSEPIQQEWLDGMNFVFTAGSGSVSLLRKREIPWPVLLSSDRFEDLRAEFEDQLYQAGKMVAARKMPASHIRRLEELLKDLRGRMDEIIQAKAAPNARHCLNAEAFIKHELRATINQLDNPDLAALLLSVRPESRTVDALVRYLAGKGIRFGPASTGSEVHYRALHNAMAREHRNREGQKSNDR